MYRANTHQLTAEQRTEYRFGSGFEVTEYPDIAAQIGISRNGKISAKAFSGKKLSHDWYYTFQTEDRLTAHIARYIENMKRRIERKAEYKANRTISSQAAAAKMIREELKAKFPGGVFSVTSDSFANGDSVDIRWIDGPTHDQVNDITSKYQYGHFDGMIDYYENSNSRNDIPQSKWVHCSRTLSEMARAQAKAEIEKKFGIADLDDKAAQEIEGTYADNAIYRHLVNKAL